MMEAVRASDMSVYSNETTRRYIPEGCYLLNAVIFVVAQSTTYAIHSLLLRFLASRISSVCSKIHSLFTQLIYICECYSRIAG
jgi:uncharacterized membrane protein YecN with MAPEG domain